VVGPHGEVFVIQLSDKHVRLWIYKLNASFIAFQLFLQTEPAVKENTPWSGKNFQNLSASDELFFTM